MRVVAAHHDACGAATRVRLPSAVPARAVRRLRCAGCEQDFETDQVEEVETGAGAATLAERPPPASTAATASAGTVAEPPPAASPPDAAGAEPAPPGGGGISPAGSAGTADGPAPGLLDRLGLDPDARWWKLASIPLAAALVVIGLLIFQGGDDSDPAPAPTAQSEANQPGTDLPPAATGEGGGGGSGSPGSGQGDSAGASTLVRGSSYSLALPAGWKRVDPSGGATFAAVSADRDADATLWIDEDPELEFPAFITQSLQQLEGLAGSARIVERVPAPTEEATIVRLAADAPEDQPTYEVTLRVAGPYRYYLATSVQRDASAEAIGGAELISGSFTPEVRG